MSNNPNLIDKSCPVRPCDMEKGLDNCSQCKHYICLKLAKRLVVYDEVKKRINSEISEDDYRCFIMPYQNKKRLEALGDSNEKKKL